MRNIFPLRWINGMQSASMGAHYVHTSVQVQVCNYISSRGLYKVLFSGMLSDAACQYKDLNMLLSVCY